MTETCRGTWNLQANNGLKRFPLMKLSPSRGPPAGTAGCWNLRGIQAKRVIRLTRGPCGKWMPYEFGSGLEMDICVRKWNWSSMCEWGLLWFDSSQLPNEWHPYWGHWDYMILAWHRMSLNGFNLEKKCLELWWVKNARMWNLECRNLELKK